MFDGGEWGVDGGRMMREVEDVEGRLVGCDG